MSRIKNLFELKENVELIGKEINIFGDVHSKSLIDAHKLFIKGTTHSNSSQFSKYAQIKEHCGMLRCHNAHINTLNGGVVHASNVTIDNCVSGSIYAQDVNITNLSSDVTIYASNSINIESINGTNNHFTIDYQSVPILVSKLELIYEDIDELHALLQKAKENNALTQKDIKLEISRLQSECKKIENSVKYAKINIKNSIDGENVICFTIDTDNSIIYKTQEKQYKPFYLEFKTDKITLHPTHTTITL